MESKHFACRIGTGKKVHLCFSAAGPRCHIDSRHTRRGALIRIEGKVSQAQLCQHCWGDLRAPFITGKEVGIEVYPR